MTSRRVVLVTGLSGAGRSSILRMLEDLGYEAVDNPPLTLVEELVSRSDGPVAVGLDARSRGFDSAAVLDTLERLRANPQIAPELIFALADEQTLLRRYTQTRRRHPLADKGTVASGIVQEVALTSALREAAAMLIDTSELPLPDLRQAIEQRFGTATARLSVTLTSFAYPNGLPREADLVYDARFLQNPHYEPHLREQTGIDPAVAEYVEADPDFAAYFGQIEAMLRLLLPRFVQEGKKYVTIAVGCTGGKHRSVHIVQKLAATLGQWARAGGEFDTQDWRITVAHRELQRMARQVGEMRNIPGSPGLEGRSLT